MARVRQMRVFLSVFQVALAVLLGGWGEWLRYSDLNLPFLGGSGCASTARFHVWPWPLKFTLVLNLPVLAGGALISVPLDALHLPAAPEWLSEVMLLPFVALLWYWIGSHMDRTRAGDASAQKRKWQLVALLLFVGCSILASSVPLPNGGYTSFIDLGALLWLFAALAGLRLKAFRSKETAKQSG